MSSVSDSNETLDNIDPNLLSALLAAIEEHPVGKDLSKDDQLAICSLSIEKGTFGNASWLDQKAEEFRDKQNIIDTPQNSFKEVVIPEKTQIQCKEDLLQVLAQHSLWQESVLNPNKEIVGGRADLTGQTLSGYDLSGLDLRGANLQQAHIENTNLSGARLATSNLKGCTFSDVNLKDAILRRANLTSSTFRNCRIDGADFSHATIKHVEWEETDVSVATFTKDIQTGQKTNRDAESTVDVDLDADGGTENLAPANV